MIDLQIVFPQEAVLLNNVRVLPGPPRVVEVVGADFRSVDEVLINGVESPDVVIISKNNLVAQVPDVLIRQKILSVSVLSRRLTLSPRSLLKFRIGDTPGKVSGILRLTQKFLKLLFQTPGTDIFAPNSGGGALKNVGVTFGYSQGADILSNMVIAVDTTARQIVSIQSRNPAVPREERLLSAKILKAGFNKEEGAVDVSVELISQAGRAALANLEL